MHDIDTLRDRFAIPELLAFESGPGGLVRAKVKSPLAESIVYLHGAHVASYVPAGQPPLLWMSDEAVFRDGAPIRGGVPICFPWFGSPRFAPYDSNPEAPMHGLARTQAWELTDVSYIDDTIVLTMALGITPFETKYRVEIGASLNVSLTVTNVNQGVASFEVALHSYFAVNDIHQVQIHGLAGLTYLDQLDGMAHKTQSAEPITLVGETDRIYLDTVVPCEVCDLGLGRLIRIAAEGARSIVLWNPWVDKSKRMADFPNDAWPQMLCVETGNIAENRVELAPGQSHETRAMLSSFDL